MAAPATALPEVELALWRRRGVIFLFFGILALVFGSVIGEEIGDMAIFVLDDLIVLVVAVLLIVLWAIRLRSPSTVDQLAMAANVSTVLLVVAFAGKLFGAMLERNDPTDFGDEIPALYILLVGIGSRFF